QKVNALNVTTEYFDQQLQFKGTASQPDRSLDMAGSLLLHPDHQEVHLQQFGLRTQAGTWQLEPGSEPAVQYGEDALTVESLNLVNGDQQIAAKGAFGHEGDVLQISVNNVDLAGVDALLLRPPQFSGRLNALVMITGTTQVPEAKSEFQVSQGGFR